MSLINQMLTDLDKRNATAGGVQPTSSNMRNVMSERSTSSRLPLLIVALAVAIIAGVLIWKYFPDSGSKPVIPAAQVAIAPAPPAAIELAPVTEKAEPAPAAQGAIAPAPPTAIELAPVTEKAEPAPAPKAVIAVAPSAAVKPAPETGQGVHKAAPAKPARATGEKRLAQRIVTASDEPQALSEESIPVVGKQVRKSGSAGKALKIVNPQQRSDNAYRHAVAEMSRGRTAEAQEFLRQALLDNPLNHNARQLLAGLLIEGSRQGEALTLMQDGLQLVPGETQFTIMLARLQAEAGDRQAALATLQDGLSKADNNPEFHGLFATLLQREERHGEAVAHYMTALQSDPTMATWLVGLGISLQAMGKLADATEAYARALQTETLAPELAQFVEQRLKQIK